MDVVERKGSGGEGKAGKREVGRVWEIVCGEESSVLEIVRVE